MKLRLMMLAIGGAAVAVASDACVIADPANDFPSFPQTRPTILRSSVVPAPSAVLGRWPAKFIVPVELADSRSRIFWSAYVDFNPATGAGRDGPVTASDFQPNSNTTIGRTRILEVPITEPSLDGCHIVEIVVALRFRSTTDGIGAHTPDDSGGDSVSWFFSPTGDLAGCPVLDAGLPDTLDGGSDAATDANEAGVQ